MDTLRALLWKEGRAAAYRVAGCVCLALLAPWTFPLDPVCHLVGILGAILMAMDLMAGERSRGTLPFQSNLPVRTAWLLGAKYAVGAAGLACWPRTGPGSTSGFHTGGVPTSFGALSGIGPLRRLLWRDFGP